MRPRAGSVHSGGRGALLSLSNFLSLAARLGVTARPDFDGGRRLAPLDSSIRAAFELRLRAWSTCSATAVSVSLANVSAAVAAARRGCAGGKIGCSLLRLDGGPLPPEESGIDPCSLRREFRARVTDVPHRCPAPGESIDACFLRRDLMFEGGAVPPRGPPFPLLEAANRFAERDPQWEASAGALTVVVHIAGRGSQEQGIEADWVQTSLTVYQGITEQVRENNDICVSSQVVQRLRG